MLTLLVGFAMMKDDTENPEYNPKVLEVVLIVINSAAFIALLDSIIMLHPTNRKRFAARLESNHMQAKAPGTNTKVTPAAPHNSAGDRAGVMGEHELRSWSVPAAPAPAPQQAPIESTPSEAPQGAAPVLNSI